MQVIVQAIASFLDWLGLLLNMRKSIITEIDHAKNRDIATDSIKFNDMPFTVLPPVPRHSAQGSGSVNDSDS
jgi:hypothetical protein